MSAEQSSPERRALVHAALGDPSRLRIVDALALGDASASELGQLLGQPSNLVAHHVGVLERAGVVSRRRSEADRRRAYLRLEPAALDDLVPLPLRPTPRVVFVCTANSARSQLAAALWSETSTVPVTSAGVVPADAVDAGAAEAARRHHLRITQPRPQHVDDVVEPTDLVVAVCDNAHERLDPATSRIHWSVPDPVRVGTEEAFDDAVRELSDRITRLAPRLTPAS